MRCVAIDHNQRKSSILEKMQEKKIAYGKRVRLTILKALSLKFMSEKNDLKSLSVAIDLY